MVAVGLPSKLETHATTSHAGTAPARAKSESHEQAEILRSRLLERLEDEDATDLSTRLEKCGEPIRLFCGCCGRLNEFSKRCNRKWCPVCQRALATRASLRYTGICESFQWPLFVTLTVKNCPEASFDFVRQLRRSFGKLRRLRWWLKAVKGGVAGFEVTNTGKGWHPHCHTLLDCRWLGVTCHAPPRAASAEKKKQAFKRAAREVAEQWSLCTGQPSSVKIKRAYARGDGSNDSISTEIIKYSVKGSDLIDCPDPISPVLRMLDATRLLTSFGTAYGRLRDWDQVKRPTRCENCGNPGQWIAENEVLGSRRERAIRARKQNRK